MTTPATNTNGHRRRELQKRILAEETHCIICASPVDKTLTQIHGPGCDGNHRDNRPGCTPHPRGPVIDEDVPRIRGGSPLERSNCHLAHRDCNRAKGTRTLAEHAAHNQQRPAAITATTTLVDW